MKAVIQDEFTAAQVPRQRRYQLRRRRDRRCIECGAPAETASRCLKHLVKAREFQRKLRGFKRRYRKGLSYQLEARRRGRVSAPLK